MTPRIEAPELQNFYMRGAGFGRWETLFQRGEAVVGHVREFPESEYRLLAEQQIQSILVMPIFVRDDLWGIIGFDACLEEREWSGLEREALQMVASLLGEAVHRQQTEESLRQRLSELDAIQKVSGALRVAQTTDEALGILLDETLTVLKTDAGAINMYDPVNDHLRVVALRGWFKRLDHTPVKPGEGITGHVFATGRPYISGELAGDPLTRAVARPHIPRGWVAACLPIHNFNQVSGVILVAVPEQRAFAPEQIRLLGSLVELGGTALHRMSLHVETSRRLEYLQASRAVDRAISASMDLDVILDVLVDHALARLAVDAAAVLLFDPHLLELEFAAGRGFRTRSFEDIRLRLGDGLAGEMVLERKTVQIPDIIVLPDESEFVMACRQEGFVAYTGVPLIAKGQVKGVLEVYFRSPAGKTMAPDKEWLDFLEMLAGQAAIAIDNSQLFNNLQRASLDLAFAYDATIEGWSRALDLRDRETEGHTRRVTELTTRLALLMGMDETSLLHLRRGALLHDIGKMGVPDQILHKPGPLTDEEWEIMRKHPVYAYEMLSPIAYLRPALHIPYCHHEKWDGTGYPRGLKGEAIPLAARIFAVADVWDALTSDRPYRKAWPEAQALAYIRTQAGQHFDPQVVEVFLREVESAKT